MSDSNFDQKVLDFVEKSSHALEVASKIVKAAQDEREAVQEKVAALAKKLRERSLIDDHEIKTAETQLAKTSEALDILDNVLDYYTEYMKEASTKNTSIGRGVPPTEKVDKYAMYIDRHKGTNDELSNADKALLRLIDGYQVDN